MKYFTNLRAFFLVMLLLISFDSAYSVEKYSFKAMGKSYDIILESKTWLDAADFAVASGGYLTRIESLEEQKMLFDTILNGAKISPTYIAVADGGGVAYIWIGANDINEEGKWEWSSDIESEGINFWNGKSANGSPVGSSYVNWGGKSNATYNEPDDFNNFQDAAAIGLEAWPKGIGLLGKAGEWNDIKKENTLFFIVEYDFEDKPSKCELPQGNPNVCTSVTQTEYSTLAKDAFTYSWAINPQSAGSLQATNNKVVVTWNKSYLGKVELTAYASNPLGDGPTSEPLTITKVPAPAKPSVPTGENDLCGNPGTIEYNVADVQYAGEYYWSLSPSSAGSITLGTSKTASVTFKPDFIGTATISVKASNMCGESEVSSLSVVIKSKPAKASTPVGPATVDIKEQSSTYSVEEVAFAKEYKWEVLPSTAGTIEGNSKEVSLVWNSTFLGDALISVRAINECGDGEKSEMFAVKRTNNSSVIENTADISIYPNPSNGKFSIDFAEAGEYRIVITNIEGREIAQRNINGNRFESELLPKGLYLVSIKSGEYHRTQSVIVE